MDLPRGWEDLMAWPDTQKWSEDLGRKRLQILSDFSRGTLQCCDRPQSAVVADIPPATLLAGFMGHNFNLFWAEPFVRARALEFRTRASAGAPASPLAGSP